MAALDACELRSGCEVTALSEDKDGTLCVYRDSQGKERKIKSRFFVGADGKTGFTRKQYLESRGIVMEQAHQYAALTFPYVTGANNSKIGHFMRKLGWH
jgi:2-polyprenyl-6-methoxyphenol hydroxylase-like FAD-dependent oxidoreductase